MCINQYGQIVVEQWLWLRKQYSYIELDNFIVMPNHFHGIIYINNMVVTGRDLSLQMKIKSLSEIIGAFKTTSSKLIHKIGNNEFCWQRSFYDRIIRSDDELNVIREYVLYNPKKWENGEEIDY